MRNKENICEEISNLFTYGGSLANCELYLKIMVEVLLDIRDQNEEIKNQLISMKKYSVNSNDIDISKIWNETDHIL